MRRVPVPAAVLLVGVAALTAACTSGGSSGGSKPTGSTTGAPTGATSATAPATAGATGGGSASATPSSSRATVKPTSVPAPSPGNIHQTVPSRAVVTRPAVAVNATASFGDKVTVRATAVRAITAKAHGPGEIGGPAVAITLRFTNGTARAINLGNAVVTVLDSARKPASTIAGSPAHPVTGRLAAGRSATGTYVFTVPANRRKPITINVSYAPSAPVVLLVGNAG